MNILGLTAPVSWNNAAALVQDGRVVAAAEEERFNRVKLAPRMPAIESAQFCIRQAGISPRDVDAIAVGFAAPARYTYAQASALGRAGEMRHFALSFASGAEYAIQHHKLKMRLIEAMPGIRGKPWIHVPHHRAHAASAFHVSGFDRANVLTLDGNGEDDSALLGIGEGRRIRILEKKVIRQSLGVFYGNITQYVGFARHVDEGKTMGLAAFGTPRHEFSGVHIRDDDFDIDRLYNHEKFWREFRNPRQVGDPLNDHYRDVAASAQQTLERAGVAAAKRLYDRTGLRRFCMAGGVALNCDMNAKILAQEWVDDIYIQPAAHDAGSALGAALDVAARHREPGGFVMNHAYWGPEYSAAEIEKVLRETKVIYARPADIEQTTAALLAQGHMVAWFQGRMELGPRALGSRSILAHPGMPEMKDKVNREVKHREDWRPFAPSMLAEEAPNLVYDAYPSPFMLLTFTVRPEWRDRLAAAMHVDYTVRSQTVTEDVNPRYYRLIQKFQTLTGIPAVLNTSFNDRGEPIVMSPRDALRTYFSTGLDYLAIGDFLVSKRPLNPP